MHRMTDKYDKCHVTVLSCFNYFYAPMLIFYKLIYIHVTARNRFYVHFLKTQKQTFIKIREMYLLTIAGLLSWETNLHFTGNILINKNSSPTCSYINSILFPTLLLY